MHVMVQVLMTPQSPIMHMHVLEGKSASADLAVGHLAALTCQHDQWAGFHISGLLAVVWEFGDCGMVVRGMAARGLCTDAAVLGRRPRAAGLGHVWQLLLRTGRCTWP